MASLITAYVLAIAVPVVVALVLLTYVQRALLSQEARLSENYSARVGMWTTSFEQLREQLRTLQDRVRTCELGLQQTSATHLQGEVAALAADVARLAQSTKKQFGTVWAELQHSGALDVARGRQTSIPPNGHDSSDPELEAMLALQSAPAGRPK